MLSLKVKKSKEIKFAMCYNVVEAYKLLKSLRKEGYTLLRIDL